MRYWIDPPSGYLYGFPKIWDSINDPPLPEWLVASGYEDVTTKWVRTWSAEDEEYGT